MLRKLVAVDAQRRSRTPGRPGNRLEKLRATERGSAVFQRHDRGVCARWGDAYGSRSLTTTEVTHGCS
jgi:hypothetical protein